LLLMSKPPTVTSWGLFVFRFAQAIVTVVVYERGKCAHMSTKKAMHAVDLLLQLAYLDCSQS
jgi:hypothetical protein